MELIYLRWLPRRKFLEARVAAARADGKPFVIEEFGKYISRPATSDAEIKALRDPWFQDIFDIAAESQKSDGPIKGEPFQSSFSPTKRCCGRQKSGTLAQAHMSWSGCSFCTSKCSKICGLVSHSRQVNRAVKRGNVQLQTSKLSELRVVPNAGLIMWKYGVSPYHNNTDKNWVNVKDTTWTDIVAPQGKVYNFRKTAVPNCRPATGKAQLEGRGISTMSTSPASGKVCSPLTRPPSFFHCRMLSSPAPMRLLGACLVPCCRFVGNTRGLLSCRMMRGHTRCYSSLFAGH